MSEEKKRIPVYGSMSRPANPEEGLEELENGLLDWNGNKILITYETDEFTSLCPKTGQPDFNKIFISYVPDKKYIESKCMKFYLWAYRDYGIHCEHLANKIANDIKKITRASYVRVECNQKARGGLKLQSIVELGDK